MSHRVILFVLMFAALFTAACGTIATPTPEVTPTRPAAGESGTAGESAAALPTNTPEPPTATPEPPTPTPTTVPPTATPEPTEAPARPDDQVAQFVNLFGVAERGMELFNMMYDTEIGQWACASCHNVDVPEAGIGPSLLGLPERAASRVEGQVAERYIYNSILHPYDYFVEGYEEGQRMPPNYNELLVRDGNEQDVYDLIAYLMTLSEE